MIVHRLCGCLWDSEAICPKCRHAAHGATGCPVPWDAPQIEVTHEEDWDEAGDAKEAAGLERDAPLWLLLEHMRQQGYRYALMAIDEVQLHLAGGEDEGWADGFRQGWRAAREAVERRAALTPSQGDDRP